jgi:hypothetical protein
MKIQKGEFTEDQLISALTSVRKEADEYRNLLHKTQKELRDLKEICKRFEGQFLDQRTYNKRQVVR